MPDPRPRQRATADPRPLQIRLLGRPRRLQDRHWRRPRHQGLGRGRRHHEDRREGPPRHHLRLRLRRPVRRSLPSTSPSSALGHRPARPPERGELRSWNEQKKRYEGIGADNPRVQWFPGRHPTPRRPPLRGRAQEDQLDAALAMIARRMGLEASGFVAQGASLQAAAATAWPRCLLSGAAMWKQ